jgi:hypothetical protein
MEHRGRARPVRAARHVERVSRAVAEPAHLPRHHAFASVAAATSDTGGLGPETHIGPEVDARFERIAKGAISPSRVPADHVPTPADSTITGFRAGAGFDGLTHLDQRLASNGNQFNSEPPDQGLAVGNGYVLETVNTALRVRRTDGSTAAATVALNPFFGLPVAIDRTTGRFGPFTTDPRAYFDFDTQRWFVTLLEIDQDPVTGAFLGHSEVMLAVSTTANPTGTWSIFSIDVTNVTGTPEHAGCPCFGDQPLIGADKYGFYVSTNEFPLFQAGFNGAQVYAMSKAQLAAGITPPVVSFSGLPLAEGPANTLQPAITAQGGAHATTNNGTEYFLSALDFDGTLDNRIAVWALTNTQTLDSRAEPHAAQRCSTARCMASRPTCSKSPDPRRWRMPSRPARSARPARSRCR